MLLFLRRRFFKITWLRSGGNEYAYLSGYLISSGYRDYTYSARRLAVRPATHEKAVEHTVIVRERSEALRTLLSC